jgi:tetratricopeptide (TPR) repeat protein
VPDQIFISYRRDDAGYVTGHINDRLRKEFGDEFIFTDVDRIDLGVDFRASLDLMVSECQILLAVVGTAWLTVKDRDGQPRLQDPTDFVRIEIESALQRDIPVIPLLVSGARMPSKDDLPKTLKDFAFRNGTKIRPAPDFHTDIDRLIGSLKRHLDSLPKATTDEKPGHAASEAEQKDEKERKRLLGEVKLTREEDKNQNGFPDANIKVENAEKVRKQSELHSRDRGKKRWAAMVFLPLAVLLVAGASWYFFVQYQEQVEATNAALVEIQNKATAAEAKRQADAKREAEAIAAAKLEADAKRQALAIAEAVAKAEADVEARLKAEADAEAQLQADTDAEAELKAEADAEAKLKAGTDSEARRREDASAISRRKTQANTFFREGLSLAGYGDYEAAIEYYDEAIRLSPQPAFVYKQRGAAYHALGGYKAALTDYDEAIRLSAEDPSAYYSRSLSHSALGDYNAAINDCDEAIRIDPEFANAYQIRGNSHKALGNQEAAERDFAVATEIKSRR